MEENNNLNRMEKQIGVFLTELEGKDISDQDRGIIMEDLNNFMKSYSMFKEQNNEEEKNHIIKISECLTVLKDILDLLLKVGGVALLMVFISVVMKYEETGLLRSKAFKYVADLVMRSVKVI